MSTEGPPTTRSTAVRRRLLSIRAAAVAGIVAAAGWLIVLTRWLESPDIDASDAEIREYYGSVEGLSGVASLQILVWATIAFLWFIGVIRDKIGQVEPKLFGTVFFGGGIILAVLMFVGSAAFATPYIMLEESDRAVDPDVVTTTRTMASIVLGVFAPRIAALFIFSLSGLSLRTGAMPRWFIFLSYAIGVVLFVNITFASPSIYIFPTWLVVASVALLIRNPHDVSPHRV